MDYTLRRVIFEDSWQRQTEEIIDLCKDAKIKGVLLMEESHLANMAPLLLAKHQKMANIYGEMAKRLRNAGISYGINLATIVGHSDTPIPDEYQLPYQKFVGENLKEANACYCILDSNWQEYAVDVVALYSKTQPDQIFIDDDFRSLNHGQQFGCFCPLHVKKTSEILGKKVTASEIVEAWKEDNFENYKIREAWQKANFQGQLIAAQKISKAIKNINSHTKVGLMSSDEFRHSLQGRDIQQLLRAFAGPNQELLYRPTGAVYGDGIRQSLIEGHQRMALTLKQVTEKVQVVSELELFPHTRFTSSERISRIMMELQVLAGADEVSLNLYDYLGNPINKVPVWRQMLISAREDLAALQNLRAGKKLCGFGLPYKLTESLMEPSTKSGAVPHYPQRPFDLLLPRLGIPVQFEKAKGNALFGNAVNCYNDEEILSFLSNGLFIDALGAINLQKRGFGKFLGCTIENFSADEIPAMEKIISKKYGQKSFEEYLPSNWHRFRNDAKYLPVKLLPNVRTEIISEYVDLKRESLSPAMTLYNNELGGKIISQVHNPV